MELTILPKETIARTYKRFSLPLPAPETASPKKLEFFYIGRQTLYIEKLTSFFNFGYTTGLVEDALYTLKRLLKKKEDVTIPNMIIAEAALGEQQLVALHRFISGHKLLADVPFIVEGTGLSRSELAVIKRYAFIDELLFLNEFTAPALLQKAIFLKKIKQQWVNAPNQCKVETSFAEYPDLRSFLKRVLDVMLSSLTLALLSPVMLLIALAIKIESGGPVLYVSKRAGRGYRIFDFFKFRTMALGEEEKLNEFTHLNQYGARLNNPVFYKLNNDPRVTKVGLFLRKTSLDELPQLFNVLLGDMSLVGNRPLPLYEAARLTTNEWAKRFMAPAGMTGLWQIQKRGKGIMSVEERISLDNDYADKSDLLYDFWIMAHTPPAIIQKSNA